MNLARVNGIVSTDAGRIIAVGQLGSAPTQTVPIIWTGTLASADWPHICPRETAKETEGRCEDAETHGLGAAYDVVEGRGTSWRYLAVGRVPEPGEKPKSKPGDAAVWHSRNGVRWVVEESPASGSRTQLMRAAVMMGKQAVVAVGQNGKQGAAWYSTDGLSWRPATAKDFVVSRGSAELNDVVWWRRTLFAVGRKRNQAAVWISRNGGQTWKSVDSREFLVPEEHAAVMTGIAAGNSGLVAVGHVKFGDDDTGTQQIAASWTSRDGDRWKREESGSFSGHGEREMNDVVGDGDTFYAGGDATVSDNTRKAQVWTATHEP